MRGPFYDNDHSGVTGEDNDGFRPARYTVALVNGVRRTFVGDQPVPPGATVVEVVGG